MSQDKLKEGKKELDFNPIDETLARSFLAVIRAVKNNELLETCVEYEINYLRSIIDMRLFKEQYVCWEGEKR